MEPNDTMLADGDWRETMPVWAHQQLWHLREVWSGEDAPTGEVLGGRLVLYPEHPFEGDNTLTLDEALAYEADVVAADGVIRTYVMWGNLR